MYRHYYRISDGLYWGSAEKPNSDPDIGSTDVHPLPYDSMIEQQRWDQDHWIVELQSTEE